MSGSTWLRLRSERITLLLLLAVPIGAMVSYGLSNRHRRSVHAAESTAGIAMSRAVEFGDLSQVKLLIARGENVNAGHYSAVGAAARQNPPRILRWMLDRGLDQGAKATALVSAAAVLNVEAIDLLLRAGANPNFEPESGYTPLIAAVNCPDRRLEVAAVRALLDRGANPNRTNRYGQTPLSLALAVGFRGSSLSHRQAIELLIQRGAAVDLRQACVLGDPKRVQSLLQAGASPNSPGSYSVRGPTYLAAAAAEGNAEVMRLLIKAGADLHADDRSGINPLRSAIYGGNVECVKILVDAGIDANTGGMVTTSQSGSRESVIAGAVATKNYEIAKYLISRGADVNARNTEGWPYISVAAYVGLIDQVELMIRLGANVNVIDSGGATALHMAAMRDNEPMVRTLLRAGANPSLRNRKGQTAADLTHRPAILVLLNGAR